MEDSISLDLMVRIVLQCSEPDDVVELIRKDYANQYFRLWRIANRRIALFVHDASGIWNWDEYVIVTTVEWDESGTECEVSIIVTGGVSPWRNMRGRQIRGMKNAILELAERRGWKFRVTRPRRRGIQCPHCKAVYSYRADKIAEDGTAVCQNCACIFKPNQELEET